MSDPWDGWPGWPTALWSALGWTAEPDIVANYRAAAGLPPGDEMATVLSGAEYGETALRSYQAARAGWPDWPAWPPALWPGLGWGFAPGPAPENAEPASAPLTTYLEARNTP